MSLNIQSELEIKKGKLLVVFPHPDDETVMTAGLILRALKLGWQVRVLIVTNGGRGKIFIHGNGRSATEIRLDELSKAMRVLRVADWKCGGFEDARLKNSTSWQKWVGKELEDFNPNLVVSYGPGGVTGHPDHIVLSKFLYELLSKSKWQYWGVSPVGWGRRFFVHHHFVKTLMVGASLVCLNWSEVWLKWRSVMVYKSQMQLLKRLNLLWYWSVERCEGYVELKTKDNLIYKYVEFKV